VKTIQYIVIGISLGLLLAGGFWLAMCVSQDKNAAVRPPPTPAPIQVDVSGAVVRPGVYDLNKNSRVADAVEAAGGFVAEADQNGLNLAAHVENAQRLEIPYRTGFVSNEEQVNEVVSDYTPSPRGERELMDIDSASLEELNKLPDVGPAIATSSASTLSCSNGPVGTGAFVWPADNHFLSGNDYRSGHPGIDIAAGEGAPIYASDSGIVMAMGNDDSGYGNVIQIDHGNGYSTVYAHLSVIEVSMCQGVYAGEMIGAAGKTGNSRGAHLHFEIIQDGRYIDPWLVLP